MFGKWLVWRPKRRIFKWKVCYKSKIILNNKNLFDFQFSECHFWEFRGGYPLKKSHLSPNHGGADQVRVHVEFIDNIRIQNRRRYQ